MTPLAAAAAEYLAAGMEVIALIGKMPNTRWHPRGLLDALRADGLMGPEDEDTLDRMFAEPTTGIGLLIPEGVLVADVDTEAAAVAFADLVGTRAGLDTPTAQTPNGLHIWLYAGRETGSVWFEGRTLLLRGCGSYVAAPPSVHPSGVAYEWVLPLISPSGAMFMPEDVSPAIATALKLRAATENVRAAQPEREKGTVGVAFAPLTLQWEHNITGLVRAVEQAPEGNRNNVLAWAAMSAAEDGVSLEDALPQLLDASLKAGLDKREARITIRAAFGRVARRA